MRKVTRRSILAAAAGSVIPLSAEAKPWIFRGNGGFTASGGGGGGTLSSTFTVANEGGATTAFMPTPTFGLIFKKGHLPNGQAPVFTDVATGRVCKFSAAVPAMRRYYSDGSLLYCYFSLVRDISTASAQSWSVALSAGTVGGWPAMGAGLVGLNRSLTADVNPQNLVLNLPVAPIANNGLGGAAAAAWGAWCHTTNNANNLINTGALQPAKDMDGDAGTRWRLTFKCSQAINGTTGAAYGQLIATFYVFALNDLTNGFAAFGGIRWTAYLRQPFYNVDSPAKASRAFATPNYTTPANGPNWTANGVSATPLAWRGGDGQPMTSRVCTTSGGLQTTAAQNYKFGVGDGTQPMPGYFTGSIPTGVDTSSVWYALFGGTNPFSVFGISDCPSGLQVNVSGGGAFTFNPCPVVHQFTRLGFKDDNGRYLFFKGSGTFAVNTTLRVQIDRAYWLSTGLIPTWNYPTYKSIPDGGTLRDAWYGSNPWNALTIGVCFKDQSNAGDHADIGVFPNEAALDFFNQSLVSERAIRAFANCNNLWIYDFRDVNTGSIVNLSAVNYTGLPTANPTVYNNIQWFGQPNPVAGSWGGAQVPTYDNIAIGVSDVPTEHRPNFAVWAWTKHGELEFLDFMQEHANAGLLSELPYQRNMSTPNPVVGTCLGFNVEYRAMAWKFCGYAQAALFGPYDPQNPNAIGIDGTHTTKYILDVVTRTTQRVRDIFNPANNYFNAQNGNATTFFTGGSTSAFAGRKFLALYNDFQAQPPSAVGGGKFLIDGPEPHYGYIVYSFIMAHLMGDPNAAWCIDMSAQRWLQHLTQYGHYGAGGQGGLWNLFGYYNNWGSADNSDSGHHQGIVLALVNELCFPLYNAGNPVGSFSWTNGQNTFKFVGGSFIDGFQPENGDIFPYGGPIANAYYMVNYDRVANTFGLAVTEGGTAVNVVSGAGSNSLPNFIMNGLATQGEDRTLDWDGRNQLGANWVHQLRQQMCWLKVARTVIDGTAYTALDSVLSDITHRLTFTSGGWSADGYESAGGLDDVRYLVRDAV